jgi:phosphoenolpyruvate carboxykinase (ATP)
MINAALEGWLDNVEYATHKVFGLKMPIECPNVPGEVLIPKETWKDREEYDKKALFLQQQFEENYKSIKK